MSQTNGPAVVIAMALLFLAFVAATYVAPPSGSALQQQIAARVGTDLAAGR